MTGHDLGNISSTPIYFGVQQVSFPPIFLSRKNKTVRIETHSSLFGGNLETDKKSLDFFYVPKLRPTHRWKRLLPISVPVPS